MRLLKSASLSRQTSALYVVEDVHWIDEASESMLAAICEVIPRTRSMVLFTWRPEYGGALTRLPDSQRIMLGALSDSQCAALSAELLGAHPSVTDLANLITARADGNPFFVQEIVRDLVERGVLSGEAGAYASKDRVADIDVPDTLQAAIASRIDRLSDPAKRTLNAAAVIGIRFSEEDLAEIVGGTTLEELLRTQLIDQVTRSLRAPNMPFTIR